MSEELAMYRYYESLSLSDQLSDQMMSWNGRWSMLGRLVMCSQCLAIQSVENAHQPFQHLSDCVAVLRGMYPWHELIAVLHQISPLPKEHSH